MILLLILFGILHNTACDYLQEDDYTQDRLILRKLLQESSSVRTTTGAAISENVTTSPRKSYVRRNSLAVLQVVDAHGLVQHKVSTNENIRLRVKALTTPDYQSPFVKHCWYDQYETKPSNETEPTKTLEFLDNGCVKEGGELLDGSMVPFMENGILETQTEQFSLMPLFDDNFAYLGIHCDVVLCHVTEDCYFTCTKGQSKWRMDTPTDSIELSTLIEVKKEKPTTPPSPPTPVTKTQRNLNNYLIRGGRDGAPAPYLRKTTERPFLEKYQSYFTMSTLGVCVLLLLLLIGTGCMYISYKNNREPAQAGQEPASGHMTGYLDNKMTGLPNVITTNPNSVMNGRNIVTSQSPESNTVSAWPASDFNPRSPYRDTAVLTPSEAAVLEARRIMRTNQNPQRMTSHSSLPLQPSQRRHALEADPRDGYHSETGNGRVGRYSPQWHEVPNHYRDHDDVTTSPVGGELYHGHRGRSPSSEPLIQKSPYRGRVKATSLLSMALNDYFDKYGM